MAIGNWVGGRGGPVWLNGYWWFWNGIEGGNNVWDGWLGGIGGGAGCVVAAVICPV